MGGFVYHSAAFVGGLDENRTVGFSRADRCRSARAAGQCGGQNHRRHAWRPSTAVAVLCRHTILCRHTKGLLRCRNLDVEINFAQSGAAVAQQLTGGAYDVVLSTGISDAIHAIDKGAALALPPTDIQ